MLRQLIDYHESIGGTRRGRTRQRSQDDDELLPDDDLVSNMILQEGSSLAHPTADEWEVSGRECQGLFYDYRLMIPMAKMRNWPNSVSGAPYCD